MRIASEGTSPTGAGIGCGQMTVADEHIAHHKHVQGLYRELLRDVEGVTLHEAPSADYDSNFWLCTVTLDPSLRVKGQEKAYKEVVKSAVGGAAGVIHVVDSPTTDCQPNDNRRTKQDQSQVYLSYGLQGGGKAKGLTSRR